MSRMLSLALLLVAATLITACEPKVGSKRWCKNMEETSAGDWTAADALDYSTNCLIEKPEKTRSKVWCTVMKNTPTSEWSGNQAVEYGKNCLLN